MKPVVEFLICAATVLACTCNGCTAEAQPARVEARQALAVLCPSRVSLAPVFARAAERYRVPAGLLVAVSRNEANCDPLAASKSGLDFGLMQIRIGTRAARGYGEMMLLRPEVSASLGARHLAACLLLCGDIGAALGVYSGRRTCKSGRASPYARRVLGFWNEVEGERRS